MNLDFFQGYEGGGRDVALGIYILVIVLFIIGLCGIGAWTASHWVWELV